MAIEYARADAPRLEPVTEDLQKRVVRKIGMLLIHHKITNDARVLICFAP